MARWQTAVEIFEQRVAESGDRPALRTKENGSWTARSWKDWARASRETAAGLRALGVENGDRVCILASTRAEWVETDVAILYAGAVTVPIYQSNTPKECEYIIIDSQASVVFVEDPAQLGKLLGVRAALTSVKRIVMMVGAIPAAAGDWVTTLGELRARGRAWLDGNVLDAAKATKPEDVFTIVYTSGTTGPPKGVVLTHRNICFECESLESCLRITHDDEQLLFLPLAHIFAKILEWIAIARGAVTAFAENITQIVPNLGEIKPTFMGAVPRVYEKAYAKILSNFQLKRGKAVGRFVIDRALAAGKERSLAARSGKELSGLAALGSALADKLVFSKVQQIFGGRIRFFISGGAPLAGEIAEFFHVCGILVLEGYGLTETTAATHVNRPDAYRFGSVGKALPGVEVRIAADGEVLVRGPNILREYFGKAEATREAIDPDGWFHTGDIGVIEDDFLRITDRKKDIIVTAGGKNVAPQNLEGALKAQCPYVSQVMVHGDKRPYLVALITVNPDMAGKADVAETIGAAVKKLNEGLASYETIKKFEILPVDLSQEAGELTPTLKVKRKQVSEKYRALLDALYTTAPAVGTSGATENP